MAAAIGIYLASFSLIRYLIRQAPDIDIGETRRSSAFLLFDPLIDTQSSQTFSVGQQRYISLRQTLNFFTRIVVAKGTNLDSLFLGTVPDSAKRGAARGGTATAICLRISQRIQKSPELIELGNLFTPLIPRFVFHSIP